MTTLLIALLFRNSVLFENNKMSENYPNNSFDRFGDDLCEELLSHLCFEDKFKFECVSHQWKRCVLQKQFELQFKTIEYFDPSKLEVILKKCPSIQKINFGSEEEMIVSDEMIELILKYCKQLKTLLFDSTITDFKCLQKLFEIKGKDLRNITFRYQNDNQFIDCLKNCQNVEKLDVLNCYQFLGHFLKKNPKNMKFLRNLKEIDLTYGSLFTDFPVINGFKTLIESTEYGLERVGLFLNSSDHDETHILFNQIIKLKNLKQFQLSCHQFFEVNPQLISDLELMPVKCPRLKYLDIILGTKQTVLMNILNTINKFKNIKKLDLDLSPVSGNSLTEQMTIDCKPLNDCKQLTHLSLNMSNVNDLRIEDMDLPKLQDIRLYNPIVTDRALDLLMKSKYLRNVEFIHSSQYISIKKLNKFNEKKVNQLIKCCKKLENIKIFGKNYSKIQ